MSIQSELKKSHRLMMLFIFIALLVATAVTSWERWITETLFTQDQPLIEASLQLQNATNLKVAQVRDLSIASQSLEAKFHTFEEQWKMSIGIIEERKISLSLDTVQSTLADINRWHWRIQDRLIATGQQQIPLIQDIQVRADQRFHQITLLIDQPQWEKTPSALNLLKLSADIRGFSTNNIVQLMRYLENPTSESLKYYQQQRQALSNQLEQLESKSHNLPVRYKSIADSLIKTDNELRLLEQAALKNRELQVNDVRTWEQSHLLPQLAAFNHQQKQIQQELQKHIRAQSQLLTLALNLLPLFFIGLIILSFIAGQRALARTLDRILQPTQTLVTGAKAIAEGSLTSDLPVTRDDELGELTEAFNKMRQQIQEKAEKIQYNEQYLNDIFENAGEAIITTDANGNIDVFNPAAEHLFGFSHKEILGENVRRLVPLPFANEHDDYIASYRKVGRSLIMNKGREVEGINKAGETLSLHVTVSHLKREKDEHFVAIVKDHREIIEARNKLEANRRSLEIRNTHQENIETLYQISATGRELQSLKKAIESLISMFLSGSKVSIYLAHQENGVLENSSSTELPDKLSQSWCNNVFQQQQAFTVENLQEQGLEIVAGAINFNAKSYAAYPLQHEENQLGVIEVISPISFNENTKNFLSQAVPVVALQLSLVHQRETTDKLLAQTMQQAEELQQQQEEIQAVNEELQNQAQELQATEEQTRENNRLLSEKSQELETKQAALETAYQYKSEFLANMSHELRTPLNSILLLCDVMMKEQSTTPDTKENVEVIQTSGSNLLRLINEILDLAKAETGQLNLHYQELDNITSLFDPIVKEIRPLANNKDISLVVNYGELPPFWFIDTIRVEQITRNLLSNAVKFTEYGQVTLSIQQEGEKHLQIMVEDTGIGIAKEQQQNIFQAFVQLDGSITRAQGGTGLGMAITKQLVENMQGKISLRSTEGEGSQFKIILPIDNIEARQTESQSLAPSGLQTKIDNLSEEIEVQEISSPSSDLLIIEDDYDSLNSLKRIAQGSGFVPYGALSKDQARQEFNKLEQWAGIILDLVLSDGDGMGLIKEFQAKEKGIPVIIFSGKELSESNIVSLENEGHRIIYKGSETGDRLRQELLRLPKQRALLQNLNRQIPKETPPTQDTRSKYRVMVVDDDVRNSFALSKALSYAGYEVMLADNGKTALQRLSTSPEVDVVLMDVMMPEMDGLECTRLLRKDQRFKNLPIISLTAKASAQDRSDCLSAGANDYLSKPVDLSKLEHLLNTWLH